MKKAIKIATLLLVILILSSIASPFVIACEEGKNKNTQPYTVSEKASSKEHGKQYNNSTSNKGNSAKSASKASKGKKIAPTDSSKNLNKEKSQAKTPKTYREEPLDDEETVTDSVNTWIRYWVYLRMLLAAILILIIVVRKDRKRE